MVAFLIGAGVAGAVFSACGEQETLSPTEYESEVRTINQEGYTRLGDLAVTDTLPDQELLNDVREELERSANELDDLEPPPEVAEAHGMWVDGLRAAAETIGDIEDELTSEDRTVQLRAYQKLGESLASRRLEDARAAYVEAGYDVFGTPSNAGTTSD